MGDYSKQWSTATPGCLIFLVDQSNSMAKPWADGKSRAQFTADVINQTINELVATNAAGESVKNRVFISLIGYSGEYGARDIKSGYLTTFAEDTSNVKRYTKRVSDGSGGFTNMEIEMPIFLEAQAGGLTPMSGALEVARQLIVKWIDKKKDNPVPVIINVSDGKPEAEGKENSEIEVINTIKKAEEIMRIHTEDGSPLIFNVHISDNSGQEIQFPEYEYELNGHPMAELLFKISSNVPTVYKKAAKDLQLRSIADNSKGFISNASPETLIKFINFGSSGGVDRSSQ